MVMYEIFTAGNKPYTNFTNEEVSTDLIIFHQNLMMIHVRLLWVARRLLFSCFVMCLHASFVSILAFGIIVPLHN